MKNSKIARSLVVGVLGAIATVFAGAVLLPFLGVTISMTTTLLLAAGGFALGYAASELESSVLYAILMVIVLISAFAGFIGIEQAVLEGMGIFGKMLMALEGGSWMTWLIWIGGHLFVGVLMYQFYRDPTLSLSEALSATTELIAGVVGSVTGALITGIGGGLLGALLDNPVLLGIAVVGGIWLLRGRSFQRPQEVLDSVYDSYERKRDVNDQYAALAEVDEETVVDGFTEDDYTFA